MKATVRAIVALGLASSTLAACNLLVDTDGLSGGTADAGSLDAADAGDAIAVDAATDGARGETGTDAGDDPCAAVGVVFCSRFDGPASLDKFDITTDPQTRVEHDTSLFFSAPGAARFTIDPSTDMSADATLQVTSGNGVAHAVFVGMLRFERSETPNVRLVAMNVGGETAFLVDRNSSGFVLRENSVGIVGTTPAPPDATWIRIELDLDGSVAPPRVSLKVGDAAPVSGRASAGSWTPGRVFVEFGVSETNTPASKGWLAHWDDVSIRKL